MSLLLFSLKLSALSPASPSSAKPPPAQKYPNCIPGTSPSCQPPLLHSKRLTLNRKRSLQNISQPAEKAPLSYAPLNSQIFFWLVHQFHYFDPILTNPRMTRGHARWWHLATASCKKGNVRRMIAPQNGGLQ